MRIQVAEQKRVGELKVKQFTYRGKVRRIKGDLKALAYLVGAVQLTAYSEVSFKGVKADGTKLAVTFIY